MQTIPDGHGVATDRYGRFSLDVGRRDSVLVRSVGYVAVRVPIPVIDSGPWVIELDVATGRLGQVTVSASHSAAGSSSDRLSAEAVRRVPALLGESDPLKVVQLLPGIAQGAEGSVGLHVRGGSPDQTLVLLDGMPVYNASHLFGGASIFHPDAVQSMQILRAGIPAREGGRLGAVLDVVAREGRQDRLAARLGIGLLSSRATVEGPTSGAGSFLVAVRRSYLSQLARPLLSAREGPYRSSVGYDFWDAIAKTSHHLSPSIHLYASGYAGSDAFRATAEEQLSGLERDLDALAWGNTTGTLRATVDVRPGLMVSTLLGVSRYHFAAERARTVDYPDERPGEADRFRQGSTLDDLSARLDADWLVHPAHSIQVGASLHRRLFRPVQILRSTVDASGLTAYDVSISIPAWGAGLYLEDDARVRPWLRAAVGVRADVHAIEEDVDLSIQPRLRATVLAGKGWSVMASAEQSTQPLHQLTNAGIGLPTDLWVPATSDLPPERGHQLSGGVQKRFRDGLEVSVELYRREMRGVVEYRSAAADLPSSTDWEADVVAGTGRSVGFELLLRRDHGRAQGWIAYTLSRTDRSFPAIEGGRTFPYRYDRTHNLAATVSYDLTTRRRIGATWVYSTGQAATFPVASSFGSVGWIYEPRNRSRFPAYHRLDVSYDIRYGRATLSLGAYNVYNRLNPFALTLEPAPNTTSPDEVALKSISLFPLLPHVAYAIDL